MESAPTPSNELTDQELQLWEKLYLAQTEMDAAKSNHTSRDAAKKPMVTNYRDIAIPGYFGESVADARKTAAKFRELEEKIKQLQKQLDAIEEYQQEQSELS
jgi:hypothetical protein